MIGEVRHEAIHLSSIHLIGDTVEAVAWAFEEHRISECQGLIISSLIAVLLAATQTIDVGTLRPILVAFLA